MTILNPFDLPRLDRKAERRTEPGWLDGLLADPETRIVPVWHGRSLVTGPREAPRAWMPKAGEDWWRAAAGDMAVLGVLDGRAYLGVDVSALEDPDSHPELGGRGAFVDLRGIGSLMDPVEGALLAHAKALAWFHARHRFCGACGAPTIAVEAGNARICGREACAVQVFPRMDPAVIVLVHDAERDRCLLARSPRFPEGMHSVLAGFVEAGESLEATIAREIREEAGVEVTDIAYHSSQPWPFPQSLMLGFFARAATTAIVFDGEELVEGGWYDRAFLESLDRDARPGEVPFAVPPRQSIARRLIEDWLAG